MLAVLTETLDSIPVDEDGLPSFEALADGDVTNASDQSCPSSPDGSPRTPEPEEPSLVKPLHFVLAAPFTLKHLYSIAVPRAGSGSQRDSSNASIRLEVSLLLICGGAQPLIISPPTFCVFT